MDVGIHRSVRRVFPPDHLHELISDLGSVAVVPDDRPVEDCDALVTFDYGPAFLDDDLDWVHSIQAGVDRFPFEDLSRHGVRLSNSTGIHGDAVGLGTLGQGVASRADCLGMHVTGVRRTPTPVDHVERVYMPADLTDAVAEARFVVLTARSPTTRGD